MPNPNGLIGYAKAVSLFAKRSIYADNPAAHALLIGNGASVLNTLAPGTARNVAISDGADWASRALVAADIPSLSATYQPLNATLTTLSGKALQGSGDIVLATSPAIVTPTIASLTNMQHSHQNAAGGGSLDAAAIGTGTLADARLSSNIVTLTGTQTLTNKSIDAGQLTGNVLVARIATALTTPGAIGGTTPDVATFTAVTLTPVVNTTPLTITQSLTGSSALPSVSIAPTWNTSGNVNALRVNVTNTASGGSSRLLSLEAAGAMVFAVRPDGAGFFNGGTFYFGSSTAAPTFIGAGSVQLTSNKSTGTVFANFIHTNSNVALYIKSNADVYLQPDAGKVGVGIAVVNSPAARLHVLETDAVTNAVSNAAIFDHTGGTGAAGFGTGVVVAGKDSTTAGTFMARLRALFTDVTHASFKTRAVLSAYDSTGERDVIGWGADGSNPLLGFYNIATAPIAKQTVTGSRGANAALASLLTALANLGLITDSSS